MEGLKMLLRNIKMFRISETIDDDGRPCRKS